MATRIRSMMVAMVASTTLWIGGATSAHAAEWGDFTGVFKFEGKAPARAKLNVNKDLECCGKYLDEIVDESITVDANGGLANVFIYLRTPTGKKMEVHPDLIAAAAKPVVLDNVHCLFKPHALSVWGGRQSLLVTNSDPIGHAAKMDFLKNAPVNAILPATGKIELKLPNVETLPTPVSCGVHPWEIAYLKVHDSPYVAVTAADGKFKIEKIPAGEWEFQAWHENAGFLLAKPDWSKGRFKFKIKPGANDLGVIKVTPAMVQKK